MASQTLSNLNDLWPDGTSVGAFLVDAFGNATGAAVDTKSVTGGALAFTGLADATNYVAAQGGKTKRFRTPPAAAGGAAAVPGSVARVHGLIGQVYDLANAAVGAVAPAGGQRQYITVPVERAGTIDEVYLEIGTAGVDGAALLANCFVGVHKPDGTLIGTSADQTANWKSLGIKAIPITVVGGQSLAVDPATTPHVFVQILIGTQSSTAVGLMRTSNIAGRCNLGLVLPNFAYATASGALSALDSGVPGMSVPGAGVMTLGSNAYYVGVGATT